MTTETLQIDQGFGDIGKKFEPFCTGELLTCDESKFLIEWFNTHQHLTTVGSDVDYQGIRYLHIFNPFVRHIIDKMVYDIIGQIRQVDSIPVFPEMIAINKWGVGGYQEPHLDTYSNQEINLMEESGGQLEESLSLKSRLWTSIINLNDDFSGGQTYIPPCEDFPEGYVNEPIKNTALVFQGIHYWHGVKKVRRAPRYTVSMWFTQDPMKMNMMIPTKDLELNEDTQRIYSLGL